MTFTKQSLTKRMLAIILSLLFAVSSFTIAGFVPTMDAQATDVLNNTNLKIRLLTTDTLTYDEKAASGTSVETEGTVTWDSSHDYSAANFGNGEVRYKISSSNFKSLGLASSCESGGAGTTIAFMAYVNSSSDDKPFFALYHSNYNTNSYKTIFSLAPNGFINYNNSGGSPHTTAAASSNCVSSVGWHTYVIRFVSAKKLQIYIDGVLKKEETSDFYDNHTFDIPNRIRIGAVREGYLQGAANVSVRDFRMYNTAVDATQLHNNLLAIAQESIPVDPNAKYEYDFDFSKGYLDSAGTGTAKTMTNSVNSNKLQYVYWGSAQNSIGSYIRANDITIATQSDISPKIKGEHWIASVNFKAESLASDNVKAAALGIGTSSTSADLCYVSYNGHITFNDNSNDSLCANASNFSFSSNWQNKNITLFIEYNDGIVSVYYTVDSDSTKNILHNINISSNSTLKQKFESGIGGMFIGSPRKQSASWSTYTGDYTNAAGVKTSPNTNYVYFYNLHANNIINQLYPVDPDEPDTPSVDTSSIESAMTAFENKVKDGRIYTNIAAAYTAYVNCQKGLDAAKYGHDTSIDISALASALTTATNNMQVWSAPVYKNDQKFSTASSSDNGYSNAIWVQSSNERCFTGVKANGWWFNFFCHDAVYVYDGVTTPTIPVMAILQTQATYTKYAIGVYPASNLPTGLALQGFWHGIHTNNRSFSEAWNGGIRVNNAYAQNGLNYLYETSGQNSYNYYIANKINIDGNAIFGSNNTYSAQLTLPSTWKLHDGTSLSNNWEESCTNVNPTIYVLNYKRVRDKAIEKTDLFKNIVNYKEGGLSYAADALNNMPNIGFASTTTSNVSTTANNLSTAYNKYGYASSNDKTDSTDYAALRTALDNCDVLNNNDCRANYKAYADARAVARAAMKQVNSAGYITTYNSKSIATIAEDLTTAYNNLGEKGTEHLYNLTGVLNKSTKKIEYTCYRDETHNTKLIDAVAYISAVETLSNEKDIPGKYTDTSVKAAETELANNSFTTEEGSENNEIRVDFSVDDLLGDKDTKGILDTYTENILSALTTLKSRANLTTKTVKYSYELNNETIKIDGSDENGIKTVEAKYGDLITESGYTLGKDEHIVKWTIEAEGEQSRTLNYNPTTNVNYEATKNANIVCYIETDNSTADKPHTVQFIDRAGRVRAIAYANDNTEFTVDANGVKIGDDLVYEGDKLPYYHIRGFKIGSKEFKTGSTFKVTGDTNIYTIYTEEKPITITRPKDSVITNSKFPDESTYQADWDEKITVKDTSPTADFYWFINGVLLGRGSYITFRANSNAVITKEQAGDNPEKYVIIESADRIAYNTDVTYFEYNKDLNRVTLVNSFVALNNSYQMINDQITEAGVVLSTTASDAETIAKVGKKFSSTKKTDTGNQVHIAVSRTANTDFTMHALPYIVINGKTYYGKTVKTINYKA